MSTQLGSQRLDGSALTDQPITATATVIPIDAGTEWSVDSGDYPMLVLIDGELVEATSASLSGTVSLTGCTRSLNGVAKSHATGATVSPAHPFRLGLGHANRTVVPLPAGPSLPPAAPLAATVRDGVGTAFDPLTNSWLVNYPTNVETDDVMVAALVANSSVNRTFTPPAGWTTIAGSKANFGSTGTIEFFEKTTVTGADAAGSATWTLDADATGVAYVISVEDGGDVVIGTGDTDTDTTADPPSVTTGFGNVATLAVAYAAALPDGAAVAAYPAGWTHHQDEISSGGGAGDSASLGVAAIRGTATSFDAGAFTFDESEDTYAVTIGIETSAATPPTGSEPTVPALTSPTLITTAQNIKTIIEAGSIGDHFQIQAGTHTTADEVELKTDMHVRLAEGCILEGTGLSRCFIPATSTSDDVTVSGDPAATVKPIIRNYGNGTTNQFFGAIACDISDYVNGQYIYTDVDGWFISGIDFEENSSNAIKMGSNCTVYDNEIHGHTVTGIEGDRIVGGLVYGNLLYWNALNPATGAASNGAQIKVTWVNADIGRTSQTPVDRTKAQMVISTNTFEATDRNGGGGITPRGIWCDLDCQDVLVEQNTLVDHPNFGVAIEGCNGVTIGANTIENSDGFGPANGADFRSAAIVVAESTNVDVDGNTLVNCNWALMVRISNRSGDWLDPTGSLNYAYSAGPRYWILDTTAIPADLPTPGQSNIWTDNVSFTNNVLTNCGSVTIGEGTDTALQTTTGAITPGNITHSGNDYDGSVGIVFYDRSNTALSLSQWQALGRQ